MLFSFLASSLHLDLLILIFDYTIVADLLMLIIWLGKCKKVWKNNEI